MSDNLKNLSRREFLTLAGSAGAGIILASCAPSPTATPAPTAPPQPAATPTAVPHFKVRTNIEGASNPEFDEMPQVWAQRSGLFAKNGVDFELISTGQGAGVATQGIQLLLTEKIDFTEILFPADFEPIAAGAQLVGLGAIQTDATYGYWLVSKSEIKSFQDLIGRKYVISSPGGPPDGIGRYVLAKNNIPADKVTFVPLGGSSARTQALVAGQVDAALVHPQYALRLTREQPDKFRVLSDLMDYPLMWAVDATFPQNIKANRPMVVAWVKTCLQAKRAFINDRDLAISAYMEVVPTANKDDLAKVWEFYVKKGVWDPNGGLNQPLYDSTMDAYVAAGGIKQKVTWDKFMDTSILEDVLKDLGRV